MVGGYRDTGQDDTRIHERIGGYSDTGRIGRYRNTEFHG